MLKPETLSIIVSTRLYNSYKSDFDWFGPFLLRFDLECSNKIMSNSSLNI